MSSILLIVAGLGAAIVWILLSGLRSLIGQEAVGRVRKLTRALIRRSARGLPQPQRDLLIRDLLAELESPEMRETPLSQLAIALDIWLHSHSLRTAIWPKAESPHRAYLRLRGLTVALTGVISAAAVWSTLYYTQGLPSAGAITIGASWGVLYLLMNHTVGQVRHTNSMLWALPRLAIQTLAAAICALGVELWVFRPEILIATQGSAQSRLSMVESLTALQSISNGAGIWLLQLTVLLIFIAPTCTDLIWAKSWPTSYGADN
jgi:hypothetical protein